MTDPLCIHGCLPGQPCRENPCPALAPAGFRKRWATWLPGYDVETGELSDA